MLYLQEEKYIFADLRKFLSPQITNRFGPQIRKVSHLQKVNKSKQIMWVRKFAGLRFAEVISDRPPLASIQEYSNNLKQTNKPQIWKNFEHIYTQYCAALACGIMQWVMNKQSLWCAAGIFRIGFCVFSSFIVWFHYIKSQYSVCLLHHYFDEGLRLYIFFIHMKLYVLPFRY